MRNQGHVKSITVGGRPAAKPMQGVGGVRGGLLATWLGLYQQTNTEMSLAAYPDPDYLFIQSRRPEITPIVYSSQAGLNIRDVILEKNVGDGLPAQFVVENADCRLWYTRDMILDVTNVWKAAAKAAWQGAKCVVGGLPKRSMEGAEKVERKRSDGPLVPRKTKFVSVQEESIVKDEAWQFKHGRKALE